MGRRRKAVATALHQPPSPLPLNDYCAALNPYTTTVAFLLETGEEEGRRDGIASPAAVVVAATAIVVGVSSAATATILCAVSIALSILLGRRRFAAAAASAEGISFNKTLSDSASALTRDSAESTTRATVSSAADAAADRFSASAMMVEAESPAARGLRSVHFPAQRRHILRDTLGA